LKLEIIYSPDVRLVEREYVLDPSTPIVTIGRDPSATIVLTGDPSISRKHAQIEYADGAWTVRDTGSVNGIQIEHAPVQEAVLKSGVRLWIGNTIFAVDPGERIVENFTISDTDGLTGLANMRHFHRHLDELRSADPRPIALVRFDVERLKLLNDEHGHVPIDRLLVELASRLRDECPAGAFVARIAGEEFAYLLPGVEEAEARTVAASVRDRVSARAYVVGDHYLRPRINIGVAVEPRETAALLRAAEHDLYERRQRTSGKRDTCEWMVDLWSREAARTIDVGAGAGDGVFVVSDGGGGHATGWLGARLAVRTVLDRFGPATCLLGAGDVIPDEWGWAGAMQSREAGEKLYAACSSALGEIAALPRELPALFGAIDRVLSTIPAEARISSPMVGCTAIRIDGARVFGAHAGQGRVRVLRANATVFEDLLVPHLLHLVVDRMPDLGGIDRSTLPQRILCAGLGSLGTIGIDAFEATLGAGDVVLLSSEDLEIPDGDLAAVLRDPAPLTVHARSIRARLASDVAFAILRQR
jgi:diguanylate cyclase (GGDEF)-like protein